MIAAWMLHCAGVTVLLWIAGLALERAAYALRKPVRFLWLAGLALALILPALRLVVGAAAPQPASVSASPGAAPGSAPPQTRAPESVETTLLTAIPVASRLSAFDRPLLALWLAASLLWAAILIGSARRLRVRRAAWRPERVDGQPVYVSHDVGPALFGLVRYSLVLPSWVLELPPTQRHLVLAHEREHARAADPVLLLIGALLVLVQAWNPAAWLIFRRLRFAVEADCDARVLARSSEVRAYGELLLDLGERTLAGAAPIAALSEPHSHLERRVMLMTQLPSARPLLRSAAWVSLGLLLVAGAVRFPRPLAAQRPDSGEAGRAIVRIPTLGTEDVTRPFTILVFGVGNVRVGVGGAPLSDLRDTLRLSSFPAISADVTEGEVHLRLVGSGRLHIAAEVSGGPAKAFTASGTEIVLLKGGVGVAGGRAGKLEPKSDSTGSPGNSEAQAIFERYLDEKLTLEQAADALVDLTIQRKKAGLPMSGLKPAANWPTSAKAVRRADALFEEMDRRARGR